MRQATLGWALRAPLPRQHARPCGSYASSCSTAATCVCTPDPPGRGRGAAWRPRQAATCSKPRWGGLCELRSPDSTQVLRQLRLQLHRGNDLCLHPRPTWSRLRRCTAAATSSRMQQAAPGGLCELRSPDSSPGSASAKPAVAPLWRPVSAPLTRLVEVAALHGGCNKQSNAASRARVGAASSAPQTAR